MADRCYCILEGGGAKGIAHVGVLRALERSGLDLAGFAGTSAGAMVAALAAAGYSATEMFGESDSILDRLDLDPRNQSAERVNWPVETPRKLLGSGWHGMRLAPVAPKILICLLALTPILPGLLYVVGAGIGVALFSALFPAAASVFWFLQMACGLASVRPARDAINQALALKLRSRRDREPVTFSELRAKGGKPLRIVAANISTGKLVLFSAEATPDIAVADAVAASICLPVVFEPWLVNGDQHFDGGLVSNLPAWTFDVERARDRDAWTAAIEISDTDHKRSAGFGILKAAALTAVFGSSMLNTRSVERLKGLRLKVKLKLLEFNFDRTTAATIIADADKQCERRLVTQLVDVPAAMGETCGEIQTITRSYIDEARGEEEKPAFGGSIRVGLFRPVEDDPTSLVNEFSRGFESDPDERLRLARSVSLPGPSLASREVLYADDGEWLDGLDGPEDRWARKSVLRDIRWCLCVPHPKEGMELVAWVDGDEALGLEEEVEQVTIAALADEISTILAEGVPEEPSDDDNES